MDTEPEVQNEVMFQRMFVSLNPLFTRTVFCSIFLVTPLQDYNVSLQYLMKSHILSQTYEFNHNDDEIVTILLSSMAPFLCCYLHVIETINEEVNNVETAIVR